MRQSILSDLRTKADGHRSQSSRGEIAAEVFDEKLGPLLHKEWANASSTAAH